MRASHWIDSPRESSPWGCQDRPAAWSFRSSAGKQNCRFTVSRAFIKIGSCSVKHPDIELGRIPDQRLGLPIDVSVLDTLALAETLSADQIVEEGMRARVEEAIETRTFVIATALGTLQVLGITERQLQGLIDIHVKDAAKRLRPSLRIP
jgi:hypothetical protein